MADPSANRWCPHCRQVTAAAPLPQLMSDDARLVTPAPLEETQGFQRKMYCLACRKIWESLELPAEFVAVLLSAREDLEDARRQIAMLRLLSAKERQAQPQSQRPPLRVAG